MVALLTEKLRLESKGGADSGPATADGIETCATYLTIAVIDHDRELVLLFVTEEIDKAATERRIGRAEVGDRIQVESGVHELLVTDAMGIVIGVAQRRVDFAPRQRKRHWFSLVDILTV